MTVDLAITVEVALGKGPRDTLSPGDWVDLSDRVLELDLKRGRQDRTAEFEAGTVWVVLDNADGQLDPKRPGSLVNVDTVASMLCPVRVRTVYGGTTRELFNGYTGPECWNTQYSRVGGASTSTLFAGDKLWFFAQIDLPGSLYAALASLLAPDWWIRGLGGDLTAGNGDSLRDSSGNELPSYIAAGGSDVMFEAESLVPGDDDTAMRPVAGVAGYTDDSSVAAVNIDLTMACIWKGTPDGVDQEVMRQRNMTSGFVRWRLECQTTGDLVAIVYDTSGTATSFIAAPANSDPSSSGRYDDDKAHLIVVRIQGGTKLEVTVDGASASVTSGIPATMQGRVIFGGGSQTADFDEVLYWDRALSDPEVAYLSQTFAGTADPFSGDDVTTRCDRWWDIAGIPHDASDTAERHQASGEPDLLGVAQMPANLADAIRATADSYRGAVWATRAGQVRVRTLGALADATYAADYATSIANLTDEPSPSSSPPPVRRSHPEWSGVRLDRLINVSKVTWSGLSFSMRIDLSIDRYGRRVREWTSEVDDPLYAAWLALDEATRWASPPVELRTITIEPLLDANAADLAVIDLELERAIDLTWTPFGASAATETLNVQGEHWSWQLGKSLTVELSLAVA